MNLSLQTVMRCLDLVPIVRENQGISLSDLSRRISLPEKTIVNQLIPTLMLCGAPPYMPHDYVSIWLEGDAVYVEFADHFRRPVTLLPIEITALHLALTTAGLPIEEPLVAERLSSLRTKIEEALPQSQRLFLNQSDRVSLQDHPESESEPLRGLRGAIEAHRKVRVEYLSGGDSRMKTRIIHPLGIIVKDGVTYIPCFDEMRGHAIWMRLDRIHSVTVLAESFESDPSFSLERFAEDGFFAVRDPDATEITLIARGGTARWMAETVDPRQWEMTDRDELRMKIPTSRPLGAIRWILGQGSGVEIESPEEFREMAADEIAAIRALYD